ncbi:hypothetical protein [Polaribacter ponticola]|uniref:T9SS C-terminal target domain-containing protein n=1 Tax=Polaribacter ponticola TaxID=2978475 RepID=A0ABT5S829_9FLAO|nr:hypothetical protein [Polaribacter sp. MSW5]MDD7914256.1 hypothetical protein [Polaribacter sp. MSW5]
MFYKGLIKLLLFTFFANCIQHTIAQEIRVIDNKGTLKIANNNSVTSSNTSPLLPLENDIWYDTTSNPTLIKIYNDGNWVNLSKTGIEGSIFFAGADGTLTEDNAQLFWNTTNNRLGVGTDDPQTKFHVTGGVRAEGVLNSAGTFGIPAYRFSGDIDTGIFNPSADYMGFSAGGIEAFNISEITNTTTVNIKETLKLDGQILDELGVAGTVGQVLTATATGTKWEVVINDVDDELIFDGNDDGINTNDNFLYVSLIVNGAWKVIRYNKTDVNVEDTATVLTNSGQVAQPTTLAECTALTF